MKPTSSWTAIRKQLVTLDVPALVRLVKDMHDASPANRDFLAARFLTDKAPSGTRSPIESYRRRIRAVFNIHDDKLDLAGARKTIREYRKATGDLAGTVDLMLTYVEAGTDFTNEFGDIDARFYDSLCSVLDEARKLLQGEAAECLPMTEPHLVELKRKAQGLGWGYGDFVSDVVEELLQV